MTRRDRSLRTWSWAAALVLVACADPPLPKAPPTGGATTTTTAPDAPPATSPLVPVHADDPILGDRQAPLTLMVFADYQCPYCRKAQPRIAALKAHYGDDLRIVWKDFPLPFHKRARPAALAARKVQKHKGDAAFFAFHDRLLDSDLDDASLRTLLAEAGVPDAPDPELEALIDRGVADASALGITGTPGFLLDGLRRIGLKQLEDAEAVLDAHKARADALRASGVPKADIYAKLVEELFVPPPPEPEEPVSTDVFKVEVARSPTRGPKDAPVTLVVFGDFQCPFCKKHEATLAALEARYPGKLRLVFKHHPLEFHPRANAVAAFMVQVHDKGGAAAFFKVRDLIFQGNSDLSDDALAAVADKVGLDGKKLVEAATGHDLDERVDDDLEQAEDLAVHGTPCTFVNGRRVEGARKLAVFSRVIDEELQKAQARIAAGTEPGKVYEDTIAGGILRGPVELPIPATAPIRGPKDAKVVLQIFSDFECPFCRNLALPRAGIEGTGALQEIDKTFGKKLRVVFRNLPMSFHTHARRVAAFGLEAGKQRGFPAFFKLHDDLYGTSAELTDEILGGLAKKHGLDWKKALAALDGGAWDAALADDAAAAQLAHVEGTPTVLIAGRAVIGAQPFALYKRKIDRALAAAKK